MDTAKPFKATPAGAIFFEIRDYNLLVITHNDMGYPALTVDQDTDLTPNLKRKQADSLNQFWRSNVGR